jgi:PAS domain S-box-containing protein
MDIVDPERRGEMESWLRSGPGAGTPDHWRSTFISKSGAHLMMEGNSTVHIEDGRTLAVRSIFRDVTAAHEAQERLRKHAAKERAMFETSEHMFWTVDRRIALTGFNRGYSDMIHRLHGTRPEANHDPKRPKALFAPKEYHRFWEEKYAQVFSGKPVRFETDLLDQKGVRVCNEIFLSPILDDDGKVVEVFGIGHEVTSVKETQETAREQAARLKAIFESNANTMIWTLGKDMELTSLNGHFEEVMRSRLGVACEVGDSFVAGLLSRASGEMGSRVVRKLDEAFSGQPQQFEVRLERVDGHPLWMQCFVGPITVDDEVGEISCQAYDITDQKEAEHLLLENLREKEVLLKEVHHRVKNNLQIISSIFNLQKDHVDGDARSLALLHEGQNRIRSMSFIHESLYQSKNFSHVDLATYIGGLCRNLMMSYSLTGKVRLETDLQKVLLDLDRAIACGLILNELISNALKHAFPGSSDGTISIALREEEDKIGIEVSDDGKGLPDDLDEERPAGLGMELVNMLVEQLDGELRRGGVAGKRGTSYLLTFGRS